MGSPFPSRPMPISATTRKISTWCLCASTIRGRCGLAHVAEAYCDDDQVEVMLDTFHDRRRACVSNHTAGSAVGRDLDRSFARGGDQRALRHFVRHGVGLTGQSYGEPRLCGLDGDSVQEPALLYRRWQEWGVILYRGITRKTENTFWPHISLKSEGRLAQAATLTGLEGISGAQHRADSLRCDARVSGAGYAGSFEPIFSACRGQKGNRGWMRSLCFAITLRST